MAGIVSCMHAPNLAGFKRIHRNSHTQLTRTGDYTSLRFYFAFFGVNECKRDLSPIVEQVCPIYGSTEARTPDNLPRNR